MFAWFKRLWTKRSLTTTAERGAWGETLAREHLQRLGYRILAANWRNPKDRREEIDLVVLDGQALVFVEVKTRAASALVAGHHSVDARKKRTLLRAARAYLRGLENPPRSVRFDVVEVALPAADASPVSALPAPSSLSAHPTPPALRHFKNLPLFPKNFPLRVGRWRGATGH